MNEFQDLIPEEKELSPNIFGDLIPGTEKPPWVAKYPHIAAIPPTIKELATSQIPFAKYLTEEGRRELKGEFLPTGTTTEPEKLKEIQRRLVTGEEKVSPYESLAKETMTGLEWMAFPTAIRGAGAIAKEVLPKVVTRVATVPVREIPSKVRGWFRRPEIEVPKPPIAPPKPMVSGMEPPIKPEVLSVTPEVPPVEPIPKPAVVKPEVKVEPPITPEIPLGKIDSKYIHPDDISRMNEVVNVLDKVSSEFGVDIKKIGQKAYVDPLRSSALYIPSKGEIRIGLRDRGTKGEWGRVRSNEEVYSDLAHEIAHAKYLNHGKEFRSLEKQIGERISEVRRTEVPITPETLEVQVKGGPTGPLPKYAGTEAGIQPSAINLERLNTPDDVKHFLDGFTKTIEEKIGRRKYSWEEIEDIGTELGWDLKKAKSQLGRLTGGELSARIDAMRQLNATAVTDFHSKLIQLPVDPLQRTPAMKMQLREDLRKVTNSVSITSEVASEAGRALGIHRKEVGYNKLYNKIIGTIDEIYGTKELPDDLINKLQALDPTKAGELAGFLIKISKAKTMDHINRIWYDIILSNPPTHGANFIGNTLRFMWKYPEKTVTAGVEGVRRLVTGKPRERFFGEVPRDAFAIFSGIKDGVRAGMKTLKTGIPPEMGTKLDVPRMAQAQAPWGVVEAIRPTTMLGVADDMAKGVIYKTEMSGLAYRQATKEGLKGRVKDLRIQEILNSPPEELANQAWESAVEMTFQQKLGKIGNYVMRIRDVNIPGTNIKPLIFVMPFIKTGVNIAKFTAQTTPINIPWVGYKVTKGMISGPEISEQLARPFLGTMIAAATYVLAKSGYLTGGGPKSKTEKDEKLRTGWQPYSWNIGNKYYGYGRTEPIGSLWGMVADFAESEAQMTKDEKTSYFESIVKSSSKNITSKTWWQGATRALDATSDPEHYGKAFVEGLAGSFIPSVSGGLARAIDPYFREPQGIVDVWKSKIPKLSQEVPLKINVWGEPIERPSTPAMRFISPIQVSEERGTPIDYELEKLKLNLGMPSKKIKIKGFKEVELEPTEYREMVAKGGQRSKTELNKLVTKPEFKNLGEEGKIRKIRAINDRYREAARQLTLRKLRDEGRLIKESYLLESRKKGGLVTPYWETRADGTPIMQPITEMNLSNALKEWEKATPEDKLKMSPYIMKKFMESRSQSRK